MAAFRRVEDLDCWQRARRLVVEVYRLTRPGHFPRDFALQDQLRRAAISTVANIAEGFGRYRPKEFHRFLTIARGSCVEVQTLLCIAMEVGHLTALEHQQMEADARALERSLGLLMRYLRTKATHP